MTKASGRSIRITHRHVKNHQLAAVGFVWAFIAAGCDGPTRAHNLARRDHGDRHPAALRHLYNRMLGQLYHCLQTDQPTNLRTDQGIRTTPDAPHGNLIKTGRTTKRQLGHSFNPQVLTRKLGDYNG
ncbi:MAG: hypothetical protein QOF25_799 [Mycobacterium sp.]|nr:hypothetical protein [Mycobacterium sp.]